MDSEKKAIEEKKVTKPSDNVITPKDMPSPAFRIGVTVVTLAILLIIGAIYYSNINL